MSGINSSFGKHQLDISKTQVENLLMSLVASGLQVKAGRSTTQGGWSVELGPGKWFGVQPHPHSKGSWCISNMIGRITAPKDSIEELSLSIQNACAEFGFSINNIPSQQNTERAKPFSTWLKLRDMIGIHSIEAIYDPFINTAALANLHHLSNLGVKISSDLKLLTCQSDITITSLNKFNAELKINTEFRITLKNHPRLIFLSNGLCLSPDFSLNKEQDGTISTVDTAPKKKLFDADWNRGSLLS